MSEEAKNTVPETEQPETAPEEKTAAAAPEQAAAEAATEEDKKKDGGWFNKKAREMEAVKACLLYTSPSPRDPKTSRMPSSA